MYVSKIYTNDMYMKLGIFKDSEPYPKYFPLGYNIWLIKNFNKYTHFSHL